jgi:hypothetical protein
MKALVYHGPGAKAWEDFPMPALLADIARRRPGPRLVRDGVVLSK